MIIAGNSDLLNNLQAYIPDDRRRAVARGDVMPDRVHGAALFADISGFTPLTEALALELGPHRGAEELTKHLNRVFHGVISDLHRWGGTVIYFSGDAITCWFDGDDGSRATSCGLMMQDTMQHLHEIVTPAGTRVTLAMKVAVAVGPARRFVVGDPELQLIDVLGGRLIDDLARAEHHALPGEVVLDASAMDSLGSRVSIGEIRTDDSGARCTTALSAPANTPAAENSEGSTTLPHDVAKRWVWPSVYERLSTGSGEFLTELRPAYPVFARFGGIDYDSDNDAPAKLDTFVRAVQRVFFAYGGSLVHLSVGDKGAYLYGVFGSPNAHEDDAARALATALELRDIPQKTGITELQIGVTYGRLRSGTYGHQDRQAFTCLGDAVNLAARLMAHAPQGRIYASTEVYAAARNGFVWTELGPIRVKGKREPVATFELNAVQKHAERSASSGELPMVGRKAELARLIAGVDAALAGNGSVIGIAAEAGMGKSRLITEFARGVTARDIGVATGECQAYGSRTSYFVWRDIWRRLFGVDDSLDDAAKIGRVERQLAAIDVALVPRSPLLASVLDLSIPDNELTGSFDAKLRKGSLEALLSDCLRALAGERPLVIVLEDCHWLDALSRDLLEVLARSVPGLRCLFVVAYRPGGERGGGLGLQKLEHFDEIALTELEPAESAALVGLKVKQMLGVDAEAPAALIALITARAQGNPFYVEELLNYIRSKGVDLEDARGLKSIELPGSLHSLILSRIDALGEGARRTLKVASVVGRVFRAPVLRDIYPELGVLETIAEELTTLRGADLVHPDVEQEQSYIFKHAVTHEVAYESMPFAFRSALHERVGHFIERTEADSIDRHLDILAHHYWHSENIAKKREYLGRAGSAAQAAYANSAAMDYF
ncbi:MAG: AAA family ATPase, partial [Pseudomonadota bacterium]|nr:AAA family ATPase [Pseudomonadota bacterium]